MTYWALTALLAAGAYLLGAVPFGFLIGKAHGLDIRTLGSRNIGATNVQRVLGKKWGLLAFFLDVAKGLAPTLLAGRVLLTSGPASLSPPVQYTAWLSVGLAAVLGHNFPVYLKFKGGKGVATSLGVVLGFYPYFTFAGLGAFALWIVCVGLTRYVSVGSMTAALAMPLIYILLALKQNWQPFSRQLPLTVFAALMALLIIYRHRANIQRLRQGTENKIGTSSSRQQPGR